MIKIKRSNLISFLSKTGQGSKVLPVLGNILVRVERGTAWLTQSSMDAFVTGEMECEAQQDITLLVDQAKLQVAVSESTSDEITITYTPLPEDQKNGKHNVQISDGKLLNIRFQSPHPVLFPVIPKPESEQYTLTPEAVESIYVANAHTSDRPGVQESFKYVHVKPLDKKRFAIGATTGVIFYYKEIEDLEGMVSACFDNATCKALASFTGTGIIYSYNDKFHFFDSADTRFGFRRSEFVQVMNVDMIKGNLDDAQHCTFDRKELLQLCRTAKALRPSIAATPAVLSPLEKNPDLWSFRYYQKEWEIDVWSELSVKKNKKFELPTIYFNPEDMADLLRHLTFDEIKISEMKLPGTFAVMSATDEEAGYIGAIVSQVMQGEPAPATKK